MLTLPVSFSALKTTTATYADSLVKDPQFAVAITGADRYAIIGSLGHLEKLLTKAVAIEPNGYRPVSNDAARLALINTIFFMAATFIASIQSIEFSDNNDMERLVGGLLAMARRIHELEKDVEMELAAETMAAKLSPKQEEPKVTKSVRRRGT